MCYVLKGQKSAPRGHPARPSSPDPLRLPPAPPLLELHSALPCGSPARLGPHSIITASPDPRRLVLALCTPAGARGPPACQDVATISPEKERTRLVLPPKEGFGTFSYALWEVHTRGQVSSLTFSVSHDNFCQKGKMDGHVLSSSVVLGAMWVTMGLSVTSRDHSTSWNDCLALF